LQRSDLDKLRQPYKWSVINEQFSSNVLRQSHDASCISAVGEMLTEGRITEAELMEKLGTPGNIKELPKLLGDEWTSEVRKNTSLRELSKQGPWAAEMIEGGFPKKPLHVVLVDGISESGNVRIRDPWEGTAYEMNAKHFIEDVWTGKAVYRKF